MNATREPGPYAEPTSVIDLTRNYRRAFHFGGVGNLIVDTWMASYKELDAMVTSIGDDCYYWFPQASIDRTLQEGTNFFSNAEVFEQYHAGYHAFLSELKTVSEKSLARPEVSREDVAEFFSYLNRIFSYFYKTEFFFVDKAYAESIESSVARNNLQRNYVLKEKARIESINDVYQGKDSYLFRLVRAICALHEGVREEDLHEYLVSEIDALWDGKKVPTEEIQARKTGRVVAAKDTVVFRKFGVPTIPEIRQLLQFSGETSAVSESLTGISASKGKVRGRVKVIISNPSTYDALPGEFAKMQKGDILVAETTSPEFMPACMKAAAILADQGGLLSHAAVISRELKIPAIVGLRIATQVLKDGDFVEVDAERGVVKVIESVG